MSHHPAFSNYNAGEPMHITYLETAKECLDCANQFDGFYNSLEPTGWHNKELYVNISVGVYQKTFHAALQTMDASQKQLIYQQIIQASKFAIKLIDDPIRRYQIVA